MPLIHVLQHSATSRHPPASLFFLETQSAPRHYNTRLGDLVLAAQRFFILLKLVCFSPQTGPGCRGELLNLASGLGAGFEN